MLPRWHVLSGAIFCGLLKVFTPSISYSALTLIFFSSFLIDFDHYMAVVSKTKKISLFSAFDYYEKEGMKNKKNHARGIHNKGDFHIFHTIEFHILVALLGILWTPMFYVFIGMTFHSLLDVGWMIQKDVLYSREFFFSNWLRRRF